MLLENSLTFNPLSQVTVRPFVLLCVCVCCPLAALYMCSVCQCTYLCYLRSLQLCSCSFRLTSHLCSSSLLSPADLSSADVTMTTKQRESQRDEMSKGGGGVRKASGGGWIVTCVL